MTSTHRLGTRLGLFLAVLVAALGFSQVALGVPASGVSNVSVSLLTSNTVGKATAVDVAFTVHAALSASTDTLTVAFPAGTDTSTLVVSNISVQNVTSSTSGQVLTMTGNTVGAVTVIVPTAFAAGDNGIIHFTTVANHSIINPTTASESYTATVRTSKEATPIASAAYTVNPDVQTTYAIPGISGMTAGVGVTASVRAVDQYGNVEAFGPNAVNASRNLTFSGLATAPDTSAPTATSGAPVAFGTATSLTFSGGAATTTITTYAAQTGVKVHVTDGTFAGDSATFNVAAGNASHFALTGAPAVASTVTVPSTISLSIQALDTWNNPVTSGADNYAGVDRTITISGLLGSRTGLHSTATDKSNAAVRIGIPLTLTFNASATATTTITPKGVGSNLTLTVAGALGPTTTSPAFNVAPGPIDAFEVKDAGNGAETAGTAFSITLNAVDVYGNLATTYTGAHAMTWTTTAQSIGANTLILPTNANETFTNGVATVATTAKLFKAETATITASDGTTTRASKNIVVADAGASTFTVTSQHTATEVAGSGFTVTLQALDTYGNLAASYQGARTVTWASTAGSVGTHNPGLPTNGTYTFDATGALSGVSGYLLFKAESPQISATGSGTPSPTGSLTLTVSDAGASTFLVTPSVAGTKTAGAAFTVDLQAQDQWGNNAATYAGTHIIVFTTTAGSPALGNPVVAASVARTFSASGSVTSVPGFRLYKAWESPTIRATDSVTAAITGTSAALSVADAGAPYNFKVTPSGGGIVTAGVGFTVDLQAQDAYGNAAHSYTGAKNIDWSTTATSMGANAPTTPGLNAATTFDANGVAAGITGFKVFKAFEAAATITAADHTTVAWTGTSAALTVNDAGINSITVADSGAGAETAGTPFSVTITALDQWGNQARSYAGARLVAWSWGATAIGSNSPVKPADGNQTFDASGVATVSGFTLYKVETPTITATTGTKSAPTGAITVTDAGASTFVVTTQHAGTEAAGTAFSVNLQARDQYGNNAATYQGPHNITFTSNATASLTGTTPVIPAAAVALTFDATGAATTGTSFALYNAGDTPYLQAKDNAVVGSANITVTPGLIWGLAVTDTVNGTVRAGQAFSVKLSAFDTWRNVATAFTGPQAVTWTWTAGNIGANTAAKPADGNQTFTNGVATVAGFTAYKAEGMTITATVPGTSGSTGVIAVADGGVSNFTVADAGAGPETAGVPFSVSIAAFDTYGNQAKSYAGEHNLNWSTTATSVTNPVTNVTKAPALPAGGNQTFDANGVAMVSVTLYNAAETPNISATPAGGPMTVTASPITVNPAAASALSVSGQPNPSVVAGGTFPLTLKAIDTYGNTIKAYTGDKVLVFGGLASSPAPVSTKPTATDKTSATVAFGTNTTVTFANGVATSTVAAYNAGTTIVTVAQSALSGWTGTFTVLPAALSSVSASAAANTLPAGLGFQITLTRNDQYGNVRTQDTGSFNITTALASTEPYPLKAATAPYSQGVATVSYILFKAQNNSLTITDTASALAANTVTMNVTAGPFSKLQILVPGETAVPGDNGVAGTGGLNTGKSGTAAAQTAGASFTVAVGAVDAYWNLVNTVTDNVTLTSTDAQFTPATFALVAGTNTGNTAAVLKTVAQGGQTLRVADTTSTSIPTVSSAAITVSPGAVTHFSVVPSLNTVITGTGFTVNVYARDAWNNTNTAYNGAVTFALAAAQTRAATLPAGNQSLVNGVLRNAPVTLWDLGSQTIKVTETGANPMVGQATVAVNPAPVYGGGGGGVVTPIANVAVYGSSQAEAGASATFTAGGTSAQGAIVPASFTWSASGGTITSAGVWTAPTAPGSYTITATANGISGTLVVQVAHGPVVTLSIKPTGAVSLTAGASQAFSYTAADSYGNAITDAAAVWTVSGAGSISATGTYSSKQAGTATVSLTLGTKTVTSATITVTTADAAKVTVSGPDTLQAGDSAAFTAVVADQFGNAVSGATVTWSATGGTIDASGKFTAGNTAGSASVTASAGGISGTAPLQITSQPAPQPITSAGNTVSSSTQPTPPAATVLVGPAVIVGSGQVEAHFNLGLSNPAGTTLAYYYNAHFQTWIAVPTSLTATGAVAKVPAGVPVVLMQGTVAQPTDLATDHWAAPYVLELESMGLISGMPDGSYQPAQNVNRYQIAKVLALAAGYDLNNADLSVLSKLPDAGQIPEWAKPYVAAVVSHSLMLGTDTGFSGDASVTRAQMAALVGRLLPNSTGAALTFTDAGTVPAWAQDGTAKAVALGILSGYPDGSFRPNAPLTRAEMAKVIVLLLHLLA